MTDSTALSERGLSASAKKQVRRAGAVLAALLALVAISSHLKAQAALRVLGPVDTSIGGVHKWPMGVIDETGVSLMPCIDAFGAVPVCLVGSDLPNPGPASVPDNIPGEFFYSIADSDIGNVTDPDGGTPSKDAVFRFGVEASIDPTGQFFFSRVRTRIRGGLVAGRFYRITHPYGVIEGPATAVAGRADFNVTEDLGCPPLAPQPCDYNSMLTTRTFPFLVWDGTGIPTPAGRIGDINIPHTVTGSPFGTNFIKVERISGPGGSPVGPPIASSARFFVTGKLVDFTPPTAAITAPLAGNVLGNVTVTATGADEPKGSGLASLKIVLDDVTTLATSATSPASAVWNTTTVPNGPHTLKAIAADVAGNVGTSAVVAVNVNNPVLVTVPNVVGQLQANAEAAITAAHLVPAINTANDAVVAAGRVISQAPAGGASALTGSTVTLLVSLGPAGPPPIGATAAFVTTDIATHGTWQGVYGADGYMLANGPASLPAYAAVTLSGQASFTWVASTADVRALQRPSPATDRLAATWFGNVFNIDVNLTDGLTHQVAVYGLDWDSNQRVERVDVLDAVSGAVLDTRTLTASFNGGQYLVWNLHGHVTLRVTKLVGGNAVISGLLFGGAGAVAPPVVTTAAFVTTDIATHGTWQGVYGADGYTLANGPSSLPAYAAVTLTGQAAFTWVASTADVRAMQRPLPATDRLAATWFSATAFDIDVNLTDGLTHQVAVYGLDWDSNERVERVDVLDAGSGAVLDTRTLSAFNGGKYLVWNLRGHVKLRVTKQVGGNSVISGVLFR